MRIRNRNASSVSGRRRLTGGVAAAGLVVLCVVGGAGSAGAAQLAQTATACTSYWPSPYQVCDEIRDLYTALGGPTGSLGFPTSSAQTDGGGLRQAFVNGSIFWSPSTGAYVE